MGLKWTDVQEIAIRLEEAHPEVDPQYVRFTDLHRWVCEMDEFEDSPAWGGEKVLEAIQAAWLAERE